MSEDLVPSPEEQLSREQLYHSFIDSLAMVRQKERMIAGVVLGLGPAGLSGLEKNELDSQEDVDHLMDNREKLRQVYFGHGPHTAKFNEITNTAITNGMKHQDGDYTALEDPHMAAEIKALARAGIIYRLSQKQLHAARVARHNHHHGSGNSLKGLRSNDTDELIAFNHRVRGLIEGPIGRQMSLNREKVRDILHTLLPGDREESEAIEQGIAIEIALKHLLASRVMDDGPVKSVVYGDIGQDKVGGDIILNPSTSQELLLDVKQTPPNKLRTRLSDEATARPGMFFEDEHKAYFWLGSENSVSNGYGVQSDVVHEAELFLKKASPSRQHTMVA